MREDLSDFSEIYLFSAGFIWFLRHLSVRNKGILCLSKRNADRHLWGEIPCPVFWLKADSSVRCCWRDGAARFLRWFRQSETSDGDVRIPEGWDKGFPPHLLIRRTGPIGAEVCTTGPFYPSLVFSPPQGPFGGARGESEPLASAFAYLLARFSALKPCQSRSTKWKMREREREKFF